MDIKERRDLQMLRVSKGADELKQLIDYWSKSSNSNGQQNYIFNDLLRGALELQESLLILSNLQKTSREMPMKTMRQSERENFEEENSFDLIRHERLQEHRLSFDSSSTNHMQEMKQVIRDKLNKFDNGKVLSTKNSILSKNGVEFSSKAKNKAPNLIARLMGLEDFPLDDQIGIEKKEKLLRRSRSHEVKSKSLDEIIETMRARSILKSEQQSVNLMINSDLRYGANFSKKDKVPPIVIMKSINLPCNEREEINPISETSGLILDDKVSEVSEILEQSELMSNEEKIEEPQKHKIVATTSEKKVKRNSVLKERKRIDDSKKIEINGKKQADKKKLKANRECMSMNSIEKFTCQRNESSEQSRKNKISMKTASCNSLSSVGKEKISVGRPIRNAIKLEDTKSKDGFSSCQSFLAADSLLKQAQKEPTRPFKKGNP